jgi:hypothetical protein
MAIAKCQAPTQVSQMQEVLLVSLDHFREELQAQMGRATKAGFLDILVNSAELNRSVGGYPGSTSEMATCCDAMQAEMKLGDTLVLDRNTGPGMTVRYW